MLPTSMKGEGFYKTYSSVQRMVIHQVLPLLSQSVGRISLPDHGQPFTIVDYGCGEGKNSMIPVRAVVDAVRARRRHEDFLVIHNDLPTNNFNGLLQDVFADRDDSYLPTVPDGDCGKIYVLAGASSFYQQVAPSGSVHFGFSSSALHWLKVVPEGCLREHIFHWGGTVAERQRLAKLAGDDWCLIWSQRAKELAPGARMVVTTAGSLDESNGESGKPLHSGQMVMNLLNDVILDMVQEELIDRLLYEAFSLPIYMRNKAELVAPFIDRQNDLSRAFSLEYGQIQKMSCPFYEELQDTHDRKKYAHSLCNTVRAFTEPMLIKGLFPSSCPREVIERTTSEIYARMEQAVESDPDRYKFDVVQLVAVLARN